MGKSGPSRLENDRLVASYPAIRGATRWVGPLTSVETGISGNLTHDRHPIASHDTVSETVLTPHIPYNRAELLVVFTSILPLHTDLEHLNLNVSLLPRQN